MQLQLQCQYRQKRLKPAVSIWWPGPAMMELCQVQTQLLWRNVRSSSSIKQAGGVPEKEEAQQQYTITQSSSRVTSKSRVQRRAWRCIFFGLNAEECAMVYEQQQ